MLKKSIKCKSAILNKIGAEKPYSKSKPISIETVTLESPGEEVVLLYRLDFLILIRK